MDPMSYIMSLELQRREITWRSWGNIAVANLRENGLGDEKDSRVRTQVC